MNLSFDDITVKKAGRYLLGAGVLACAVRREELRGKPVP
jgi:hypothetical protein